MSTLPVEQVNASRGINPSLNYALPLEEERAIAERRRGEPVVVNAKPPTALVCDGSLYVQVGYSEARMTFDAARDFAYRVLALTNAACEAIADASTRRDHA